MRACPGTVPERGQTPMVYGQALSPATTPFAASRPPRRMLHSAADCQPQGRPALKVLLDQKQLQSGVSRLASEIRAVYGDRPLTIIGIMTGSVVLLADVIRELDMPLRVGVVQTSSYRGTQRGQLTINADMMLDITGRDVLLIDDIFDTGHTLAEVIQLMGDLGPTSLRSAVLLRKSGRQQVELRPDFVAFEIPDEFVVGYGLDYNDEYRNLPWLAVLEPADLAART